MSNAASSHGDNAMSEKLTAQETEGFDPHYLIVHQFPQTTTLQTRTVLAAAIRNPYETTQSLAEFADVSENTVADATAAFFRGTLESRGDNETGMKFEYSGTRSITDFTTKKQVVIEFMARYPKMTSSSGREEVGWSWPDINNYLATEEGVEMSQSYPASISREHEDFIESYREQLAAQGEMPAEPAPEKAPEVPESVYDRLSPHVELPTENLDTIDQPDETWVKPYRSVSLISTDETTLPHAGDGPSTVRSIARPTDDETVTNQKANATYSGPLSGIDARTEKLTHLSNVANKITGEKPAPVEVEIPRPLRETLEEQVEDGHFESVGSALVHHAVSGEVPESPYQEALEQAIQRINGFCQILESEYDLHENEHTAARLNTVQWVRDTVEDTYDAVEDNE